MVSVRAPRWLVLAFALAVSTAWAGWKPPATLGSQVPRDVNLVDAGSAAVSTNTGASACFMGPADSTMTTGATVAGNMAGARLGPGGCVYALNIGGQFVASTPTCGPNGTARDPIGDALVTAPSGAGFATSDDGVGESYFEYHQDAGLVGGWQQLQQLFIPTNLRQCSATTVGAMDVAICIDSRTGSARVLRTDGGNSQIINFGAPASAITVFRHGPRPGYIVGFVDGGLARNLDFSGATITAQGVVLAPLGEVTALGFSREGGDIYGSGFGIAGTDAGLYGAIPRDDDPGNWWIRRDAGSLPNMIRARCLDAYNCVLLSAAPGNPAIGWYYNLNAPMLIDGGSAVLITADAGSTVRVSMPVVDLDGDPLWFTYGDAGVLTLAALGISNEEADVTVPASVQCGGETFTFTFRASDGLATNVRQFTGVVDVPRNDPPGAPVLGMNPITLVTGQGPQFVSVTVLSTGCPPTSLVATPPSNPGFTVTPTDGGYIFTPASTYCALDGGGNVVVTLGNAGGTANSNLQVNLVPWGYSDAGAFVPSSVTFDAGGNTTVGLSMGHACETSTGFPGLDFSYTVDGGGPSLSVARAPDGGLLITSSDACTAAQLQITAQSFVRGEDAGRLSLDSATVNVSSVVNYPNVTAADFDAGATYSDATAMVTACAELAAVCTAQRGLGAEVTIFGSSFVSITDAGAVPLSGCASIGVPGVCNGGTFFARVQVVGNTGSATPIFQDFQFDAGYRRATVGGVTTPDVFVVCNQPVSFQAAAQGAATGCGAQEYGWSQVSGPPVSFAPVVAAQTTVTLDPITDFDALAGGKIGLVVISDAGFDNVSPPFNHEVTLQPGAFVAVRHEYEPLPAREGEALPVRTTLTNTTPCAVSGLQLVEALGALHYVEGSARVNGERVIVPTPEDGGLSIGPISLAENGKAVVTWLARAPMTSRPAVTGHVVMRAEEFKVSIDETAPQQPACGCGSAPATGALALLALARLLRRNRKR